MNRLGIRISDIERRMNPEERETRYIVYVTNETDSELEKEIALEKAIAECERKEGIEINREEIEKLCISIVAQREYGISEDPTYTT